MSGLLPTWVSGWEDQDVQDVNQDSSSLAPPIGSNIPSTPPQLGRHAEMPRVPLKPEDGSQLCASAAAAQKMREQQSDHTKMQTQAQQQQNQTPIIPAITVPSLILTAL